MSPMIHKSDTCNCKKLKTCNLEKTYHEILKTYANKFDTMK